MVREIEKKDVETARRTSTAFADKIWIFGTEFVHVP